MALELKRPIVFFDLETTGVNVASDRIVEISMLKISPSGDEDEKTYKINPTVPIPKLTSEIHGIYDKDVVDCPTFKQVGKTIANFMKDCDLAGYNSNKFDIPMLAEEFLRAEIDFDFTKRKFVDAQVVFMKKEPRTLTAALQFYCNKKLENAHSAAADTRATYEVLLAQLERYEDLENNVDFLCKFSTQNRNVDFAGKIVFDKNDVEVFNFGKHKGKSVEKVFAEEPSYYSWMMNGQFPLNTKKTITSIKLRSFKH